MALRRVSRTGSKRRLPTGQSLCAGDHWPVFTSTATPIVDLSKWSLKGYGEVERPFEIGWGDLATLPSVKIKVDIHCVEGWSRLGDLWEGVPMSYVIEYVSTKAKFVIAHAMGGYKTALPIESLLVDGAMLCYGHNGGNLTLEHGWPLRLLVPGKYFFKSAKWLVGLEFTSRHELGFYESRGYDDHADPWSPKA